MDILNPPKSYINWRCATHDWEKSNDSSPEEFNKIRKKFYKEFPETEEEIKRFCSWLIEARNNKDLPYEKIETRDSDGKKRGHVVRMMIYDIEYWREGGQVKSKKLYVANQGDLAMPEIQKKPITDGKAAAAGEYQEEVPF